MGSPAYIRYTTTYLAALRVPLVLQHQVLPLAEVPHQLQVPQVPEATIQSSQLRLQLLCGSRSATPPTAQYTAPGSPHPGSAPTSSRALPVEPPLVGGGNHQTLPRPRPEEHVTALPRGHHNDTSLGRSIIITGPRPNILSTSPLPCSQLSPRWSHRPLAGWCSDQLDLSSTRSHIYTNKHMIASTSIQISTICYTI
jgi:hypothetical protein